MIILKTFLSCIWWWIKKLFSVIFWWLFWKLTMDIEVNFFLKKSNYQQNYVVMNYSYIYMYLTYFGECIFSSFSWSVMAVIISHWALNKSMNSSRISWTSQMNLMSQLVFWLQRTETSGLRPMNSSPKVRMAEVIAVGFQQIPEREELH